MSNMRNCPVCQHVANSEQNIKSTSELKQTAATYGGKFAGKQVGGAVGSMIGAFLGVEELGYQLGASAGGYLAGEAVKDHYSAPKWDGSYTFTCPHCGLKWHSSRSNAEILEAIRSRKASEEEGHIGQMFGNLLFPIVSSAITWWAWYYCNTHESKSYSHYYEGIFGFGAGDVYSTNWSWYFVGFLMIVFGLASIALIWMALFDSESSIWKCISDHKRALKVRKMTLIEYVKEFPQRFSFEQPKR